MRIQEFNYLVNITEVLLWQYNNALRIQSLLEQKQNWYDENQSEFWGAWYYDVFNLITATEFGLSVWSIILDLPLFIGPDPDLDDKPIFGFEDVNENFEHGNFANSTPFNSLTVEEKRLLLRLRYYQLTSRCSIPEDNRFLKMLFENYGPTYILDGLDMSIVVVFLYALPERLRYALEKLDLFPRGSGVKIRFVIDPDSAFGFGEFNQNFEHGNFIA